MAFKMKAGKEGPMKKNFASAFKDKGKTKLKDKVKAAAGALVDTAKEELRNPAQQGPDADQNWKRFSRFYKKRKKSSRESGTN